MDLSQLIKYVGAVLLGTAVIFNGLGALQDGLTKLYDAKVKELDEQCYVKNAVKRIPEADTNAQIDCVAEKKTDLDKLWKPALKAVGDLLNAASAATSSASAPASSSSGS